MDRIFESVQVDLLMESIVDWASKIAIALVIFVVGMRLVRIALRGAQKAMELRKVEATLSSFLHSLVKITLQAIVLVATIHQLGVATTSIVALIGAAGLAVGMALSGTLQNFAGGAMILLFKPFKVGDFIEAQGYMGTVNAIQIFTTTLNTADNRRIILPNGPLSNGSLINYSAEQKRRVEWTFGIGYGDDVDQAKKLLRDLLAEDERIFSEPVPLVELSALADSSVSILVRCWVSSEHVWPVFYSMNEKVYKAFNEAGLNIPFPQMDVHLHQ